MDFAALSGGSPGTNIGYEARLKEHELGDFLMGPARGDGLAAVQGLEPRFLGIREAFLLLSSSLFSCR